MYKRQGLYKVYKVNNKVYAVIESGDTLSGIAKAEVNDPNAWRKMNYKGDPGQLSVGQEIEITGIYNSNYPISGVQSSDSNYYAGLELRNPVEIPWISMDVHFGDVYKRQV